MFTPKRRRNKNDPFDLRCRKYNRWRQTLDRRLTTQRTVVLYGRGEDRHELLMHLNCRPDIKIHNIEVDGNHGLRVEVSREERFLFAT